MACNLIPIKSSANDDYADNEEFNYQQKYSRTPKQFDTERRQALSRLDLSKKGSIDESIESLVINLNKSSNFYTTSSCSGRIIVVTKPSDNIESINEKKKKGLQWQFVTHSLINDVEEYIKEVYTDQSLKLKLNPFEFFNHKVKTLHEKYVTLLNYDEEEFEQIIILHAYFNLNLTEKSFLEIWNKYQQGEYNDLLEEDEEDFEDELDWGD